MQNQQQIHSSMTIDEIFSTFPGKAPKLAQILTRHGLQCVGCSAATWETLEMGVMKHGKSTEELFQLVEKLNLCLREAHDESAVTLTEKAAIKFKEYAKMEGIDQPTLRFDERPAGCSGFEYVLDFSNGKTENDEVYTSHGIEIHVDKRALPRLIGCEIDFLDGLQSGFKISNPNVRSSCGCGSSHGY